MKLLQWTIMALYSILYQKINKQQSSTEDHILRWLVDFDTINSSKPDADTLNKRRAEQTTTLDHNKHGGLFPTKSKRSL